MTLQEIVQQQTQEARTALADMDKCRRDLLRQRAGLEGRLKRATTEIAQFRTLEKERKRLISEAEDKEIEIQQQLEDIDRQRTLLIERLLEKREERDNADSLMKDARDRTEQAQKVIKDIGSEKNALEHMLEAHEKEKSRHQARLGDSLLRALDLRMDKMKRRIDQAFAGEEERQKRLAAAEAFNNAREKDAEIKDLCGQRDQMSELISLATVPAVKAMLRESLQKIERDLQARYPGALEIEEAVPETTVAEELHYYVDSRGNTCILVPVSCSAWESIENGSGGPTEDRSMRLLWALIKGNGLGSEDGEFQITRHGCIFCGRFGDEEIVLRDGFSLDMAGSGSMEFRFMPLPAEIQEALLDEASNA